MPARTSSALPRWPAPRWLHSRRTSPARRATARVVMRTPGIDTPRRSRSIRRSRYAGLGLSMASDWTLDPRGARGRAIAVRYADKLGTARPTLPRPDTIRTARLRRTHTRSPDAKPRSRPRRIRLISGIGSVTTAFHYWPAVFGMAEAYRRSHRSARARTRARHVVRPAARASPDACTSTWVTRRARGSRPFG